MTRTTKNSGPKSSAIATTGLLTLVEAARVQGVSHRHALRLVRDIPGSMFIAGRWLIPGSAIASLRTTTARGAHARGRVKSTKACRARRRDGTCSSRSRSRSSSTSSSRTNGDA
jgi:hypothetical protein